MKPIKTALCLILFLFITSSLVGCGTGRQERRLAFLGKAIRAEIEAEIAELSAAAYPVPAADIAMEVGDSRAANIALLGAFTQLPDAPLSREDLEKILQQRFKGAVLELNQKAFAKGCAAVSKKEG